MKLGALLALVAAVTLVVASCGGNEESGTTPAKWAEGFCTTITTWTGELRTAVQPLRNLSALSRDEIEQAGGEIRSASETFKADLDALGTPETESGEEARQAVDSFSATLDEELTKIDQAVEGMSGTTGIPDAITSLTASLTSIQQAFTSMLKTIRSGDSGKELQTAFEDANACEAFG